MTCFCCEREVTMGRKAKVRPWVDLDEDLPPPAPDSAAYTHYREQTEYRWALVCQACYAAMDNDVRGGAVIDRGPLLGSQMYTLAGQSRGDKAAVRDRAKYDRWQEQEARKLGL